MAQNEQLFNRVIEAYTTPGHPVAFSAPGTVAKYFNISYKKAKEILEHEESYTSHREYKKPRTYNPHYVHKRREQIQGDLIDIRDLSRVNRGYQYLLLLIDVFTKKIWLYPMKNKTGVESAGKIREWLESLRTTPEILRTDNGKEFAARTVQAILTSYQVAWQVAFGTSKAAVAERANKTIQILIYKYLTQSETFKYIDVLEDLVESYNSRPHRSIGKMTPNEADLPRNQNRVHKIHMKRYRKLGNSRRTKLPFKNGDTVRVKIDSKIISRDRRAYAKQFTNEYFTIIGINRKMAKPMYYLKSMNSDEVIEGGFYKEELQLIRGSVFKIESVVGRRRRNGVVQLKVRWRYFNDSHDSWINQRDVTRVFRARQRRRRRT